MVPPPTRSCRSRRAAPHRPVSKEPASFGSRRSWKDRSGDWGAALRIRRKLSRDHFNTRRKTELVKKLFTIFPCEAKCTHIGDAEAGDYMRKRCGIALSKFTILQSVF